ncbi:siphovirus ReqiPepy6 Gp37-like family protein [Micromonospora sediminicola]|uniref:siphovirus ReqiPepy6 Gp37-like family protein n=1 Tax=Micromonospora sediminicola TaxID=946078 RepID=UPI0037AC52B8
MSFTVLVTGRDLSVIGDPIAHWTDLDVTLRFNEPDSGTLTAPADALTVDQLAPGNRLVVMRNPAPALGYPGEIVAAGPIEDVDHAWSIDGEPGPGSTSVSFASDLASVVAEIAYPDPAKAITAQATARRKFTATNAEAVMRALVSENVGPTALAARRIPGLALGPLAGVGGNVTAGFRVDPLGDALRAVALAGGGLGFRTRQASVGAGILFEVYQPRDLRGQVRFSRGLRNLLGYRYALGAPTASVAIVGDGSGEGTLRKFYERSSSAAASWGRTVAFVDRRDTADAAEIDQALTEALAEGGASAQLETTTVDTATQRYGVHYGLGDLVSVELNTGVVVADVVRSVNISATPNGGETTTAFIGTQSASTDPAYVRHLRNIARRLGRLEAI